MTGLQARGGASSKMERKTRRRRPPAWGRQEGSSDIHPIAGHCLLAGIDAVLPHLEPPPRPTATRLLVETLRAALARTAARGDTCQVQAAADSVRLAVDLLLAGSTEEARQVLRRARGGLVDGSDHLGSGRLSGAGPRGPASSR
jgi:hypothetical protein